MTKMPDVVKKAISKQELFCLATSTPKGIPNVVYIKYLKVVDDQTILIADNYLNKTRDNILNNGKVAFAVLDEEKGSFQIKGTARRLTEGSMFDEVQKWVTEKLPRAAAVVMHIEEIYNGAESFTDNYDSIYGAVFHWKHLLRLDRRPCTCVDLSNGISAVQI